MNKVVLGHTVHTQNEPFTPFHLSPDPRHSYAINLFKHR